MHLYKCFMVNSNASKHAGETRLQRQKKVDCLHAFIARMYKPGRELTRAVSWCSPDGAGLCFELQVCQGNIACIFISSKHSDQPLQVATKTGQGIFVEFA